MRKSKTLQKLKDGKIARICNLGHYLPFYIAHASHFGFDCIWLDLEHREFSGQQVQALLAMCHLHDIDCMIRPPTSEKVRLYRYLEEGATGLMIPQVNDAETAKSLVQAVKFPPVGQRGQDGAGFDNDYLLHGAGTYPLEANNETFLVVQIETPEGVDHADAIAAVSGVDGLFIGPGDLGIRLPFRPGLTLEKTRQIVHAACQKNGKAWGYPAATGANVKELKEEGAQLINYGGEFFAVMQMLEQCAKSFAECE